MLSYVRGKILLEDIKLIKENVILSVNSGYLGIIVASIWKFFVIPTKNSFTFEACSQGFRLGRFKQILEKPSFLS